MTETTDTTDDTDSDDEPPEPPEPTMDRVLGTLGNERRRAVIGTLAETEPIERSRLVDRVAEVETGEPVEEMSGTQRKRVQVGLYQAHFPKLEDLGVIADYDHDHEQGGKVYCGPRFDAYADALAGIEDLLADDAADDETIELGDADTGLFGRLLGGGGP